MPVSVMPEGPLNARIMVVQDCPTEPELQYNRPFAGLRGIEWDKILSTAGMLRGELFHTALIRERVKGNIIDYAVAQKKKEVTPEHSQYGRLWLTQPVFEGMELLKKEIELVKPKVIIVTGNASLYCLTGEWGMKTWRGSELKCWWEGVDAVVIPVYSPYHVQRSFSDRPIVVQDLKRAKAIAWGEIATATKAETRTGFISKPTFSQVIETLDMLLVKCEVGPLWLANDIETRQGHIACIGIAWSKSDALCIPLMCLEHSDGYWSFEEEFAIWQKLHQLLTHPNCWNIGQNFIYDAQYYHRWFMFVPNFKWDTMIAHHTMYSNQLKGLDFLSSIYCQNHIYWKNESKNWDPKMGEEQLWVYNCEDCVRTFEIAFAEMAAIDKLIADGWVELRDILTFQHDLWWAVLESMNRGVRVTETDKARLAQELMEEIHIRENWILEVVGRRVNIKSPKQMTDLFYQELGQKVVKNRQTGNPTCNSEALTKIVEREPLLIPLVQVIEELRSLGVFLSTFVTAPLDIDRRMRCSYNIAGTDTYRFSSSQNAFGSGMNLQNVPKGDD